MQMFKDGTVTCCEHAAVPGHTNSGDVHMVIDKPTTEEPRPLTIGPRVRAELERRVRELENRFKPSPQEMRELASLRELLKPPTDKEDRQ